MAGQLTLLALLALVGAQILSFWIFAGERRTALEALRGDQVIGRVIAAADLMAAVPPPVRPRALAAIASPQLQMTLDAASAVGPGEADRSGGLQRRLGAALGPLARTVLVDRAEIGPPPPRWRGGNDPDRRGPRDRPRRPPLGVGTTIAIELPGGVWLNVRTRLPPILFAPALPVLVSLGLMALGVVLVVILGVRRITRPLRELADAADRVGRGERVPPLRAGGPIEVRRTTRAFDRMQDRLKRFVDDRTRMLAAISHDLRTPITTLRLRAEFVEDEEARRKILETLDEMQRMTEATLAFAREEASREETRTVDVQALVESVAEDFSDLGRDVEVAAGPRLACPCRALALKRALRNLVENALIYGRLARLRVERGPEGILIHVDDAGPGIPLADMERAFAPFVRLEESRNPETGGIGLGLAIARTVARSHGGDVRLQNRPEGGLRATLSLPAPASEPERRRG
jgi:signal transduction histidine kinase